MIIVVGVILASVLLGTVVGTGTSFWVLTGMLKVLDSRLLTKLALLVVVSFANVFEVNNNEEGMEVEEEEALEI